MINFVVAKMQQNKFMKQMQSIKVPIITECSKTFKKYFRVLFTDSGISGKYTVVNILKECLAKFSAIYMKYY